MKVRLAGYLKYVAVKLLVLTCTVIYFSIEQQVSIRNLYTNNSDACTFCFVTSTLSPDYLFEYGTCGAQTPINRLVDVMVHNNNLLLQPGVGSALSRHTRSHGMGSDGDGRVTVFDEYTNPYLKYSEMGVDKSTPTSTPPTTTTTTAVTNTPQSTPVFLFPRGLSTADTLVYSSVMCLVVLCGVMGVCYAVIWVSLELAHTVLIEWDHVPDTLSHTVNDGEVRVDDAVVQDSSPLLQQPQSSIQQQQQLQQQPQSSLQRDSWLSVLRGGVCKYTIPPAWRWHTDNHIALVLIQRCVCGVVLLLCLNAMNSLSLYPRQFHYINTNTNNNTTTAVSLESTPVGPLGVMRFMSDPSTDTTTFQQHTPIPTPMVTVGQDTIPTTGTCYLSSASPTHLTLSQLLLWTYFMLLLTTVFFAHSSPFSNLIMYAEIAVMFVFIISALTAVATTAHILQQYSLVVLISLIGSSVFELPLLMKGVRSFHHPHSVLLPIPPRDAITVYVTAPARDQQQGYGSLGDGSDADDEAPQQQQPQPQRLQQTQPPLPQLSSTSTYDGDIMLLDALVEASAYDQS